MKNGKFAFFIFIFPSKCRIIMRSFCLYHYFLLVTNKYEFDAAAQVFTIMDYRFLSNFWFWRFVNFYKCLTFVQFWQFFNFCPIFYFYKVLTFVYFSIWTIIHFLSKFSFLQFFNFCLIFILDVIISRLLVTKSSRSQ